MTTLSNKQAKQFAEIVKNFPEVEFFTFIETNDNGIGPCTRVRFNLFNNVPDQMDTTVNITDTEQW